MYKNASKSKAVKPYCKVCHDAGKPESQYTSHYVKSEPGDFGVVICPTLLNQACRFCEKVGHTVSRCPKIAEIKKQTDREKLKKREIIAPVATPLKKGSRFSCLDDLENIVQIEKPKPEKFPALATPKTQPIPNSVAQISWAAVAAPHLSIEASAGHGPPALVRQSVQRYVKTEPPVSKRWADWSSSEDEEEEEEEDW